MTKKIFLAIAVVAVVVVLAVIFTRNGKTNTPADQQAADDQAAVSTTAPDTTENPVVGLANPASVNCKDKGGTLGILKSKSGEYGVCYFEDNRQCEEWALFRGECPVGGLKITGYENDAQIYCAITGGKVEGVGTTAPLCRRIDNTLCTVQANFDGECPDPHDPNPSAGNVEAP